MKNNLDLLPPVKRARAYRLYTESKRFVDRDLDGGKAVLGHNAPNVLRELKNVADRSLFAPYPSYYTKRFEKALSLLFPGKSFVVYGSMEAVPSAIRDETPLVRPYMPSIESCTDPFLAVL
jgi:glutamate-1-semialdehyde aminotransferase